MKLSKTLLLALFATTAACGSIDSEPIEEPEVDGGTSSDDVTAPLVASVSPEDGAVGVDADAIISVSFSEPMDQASVEAAWSSTDLPGESVAFTWNAAGDAMTVTPNEPLFFGEGEGLDPDAVVRRSYGFEIGSGASDVAGNPLGTELRVAFSTKRRLVVDLTPISSLTRTRRSDGLVFGEAAVTMVAGDTSTNLQTKMFVAFETPVFPAGAVIESATLSANQGSTVNTPYVLGALETSHINSAVIDAAASDNELGLIGDISVDLTTGTKMIDVTVELEDDVANRVARGDRTQYRLEFPTATNSNNVADEARFSRSRFELTAVYVVD